MASARPKADADGESFRLRHTELSDVIRAKNKREDRFLDVRLKYYEREKNIRLNILRKEQRQLERLHTSLSEQMTRIENEKQNIPIPAWLTNRTQSDGLILPIEIPEVVVSNDWETNSSVFQSEILPLLTPDHIPPPKELLRRHSAR